MQATKSRRLSQIQGNPIAIAADLISGEIRPCYAIDPAQHLYLHYREASFIAFCCRLALKTIEGYRADGTAFGFVRFADAFIKKNASCWMLFHPSCVDMCCGFHRRCLFAGKIYPKYLNRLIVAWSLPLTVMVLFLSGDCQKCCFVQRLCRVWRSDDHSAFGLVARFQVCYEVPKNAFQCTSI